MSHIAVFFTEGFEEIEALTVVDLARRAEIETDMVSVTGQLAVCGSHNITVTCGKLLNDLDFDALDMIVLPGGPGTSHLEECEALMKQVDRFHEQGRYIAAICAAPGILGRRGLLIGHRAVSYPSVEESLKGAEIPQTEVVKSEHLITSRGMGTAVPFALQIVDTLCGTERAEALSKSVIFRMYG